MTRKTKLSLALVAIAVIVAGTAFALIDRASTPPASTTDMPASEHGDEHEEAGVVEMSSSERQAKGVTTASVGYRILADEAVVPGEVTLDLYRSSQIAPRIAAQIVARHAKLGDHVKAGQPLATLSSVEMADAQGAFIVATRDWNRVRELGRKVVSERRYVEAQVAAEQTRSKLLAFGMTTQQVDALIQNGDASKATGTFDLPAPQDGTVVKDNFIIGEIAEPGRILFQLADESRVWVEAQLTPDQAAHVKIGGAVRILIADGHALNGRVIQSYHTLDETTRTLPLRIEVDNKDDELHAGQFVNVAVEVGKSGEVLAVPETAVILMDGNSTVFKVEGDELHPTSIEIGERRAGWAEVRNGLDLGEEIAVSEVFLLKSLIQKSQMGEGHGH